MFQTFGHFDCDYMSGAIPEILDALTHTNLDCTPGYGFDGYSASAGRMILEACGLENGVVKFVIGGTEANSVVIDGLLGKCQGVLAADTAHINVHEAGTVEASGHKVLVLPTADGKITAGGITDYVTAFYNDDTWPHCVEPGMVYISFPTELGTLYSRRELEEISEACRRLKLPLYIDGARMGYGLASPACDVTLRDIARLADIFYIGGTKQGALFGEAVVSSNPDIIPRFMSLIKQHGALLAKGRLLGLQFKTLFDERRLYEKYSKQAVRHALEIKKLMTENGFPLYIDSPTNQQFFVIPNDTIDRLQKKVTFGLWGPRLETATPVRFVTSWSTTDRDIDLLADALRS